MLQGAEYSPIPMEIGDVGVVKQDQIGSILTPTTTPKYHGNHPGNPGCQAAKEEQRVSVKEMCDVSFVIMTSQKPVNVLINDFDAYL